MTEEVARKARGFAFTRRGAVEVKGKGLMDTWLLEGRRDLTRPERRSGTYEAILRAL